MNKLEKDTYKERIEKLNEYFKDQEDTQVTYTPEHIRALVNLGKIPIEVGNWFFKDLEEKRNQHKKMKDYIKNQPNVTDQEKIENFKNNFFPSSDSSKFHENIALGGELLKYLLQNREFLNSDTLLLNRKLFKDIDITKDFGIVRAIADSLYYLEKILHDMKFYNLYGNQYEAKGSIENSKEETISLEYTFPASSLKEANKNFEDYKNTMLKKGLRTWMAYWCTANEKGGLEYKCSLTEVMKWISDEEREAYFSQKEKEQFWSLTKMLGTTKLKRSKVVRRKGKNKEVIQWIEQPLVEIFGGERVLENEKDKYPAIIAVRVLMPKMGRKNFVPAVYKLSTTRLNPNDLYLAFIVQTRASHMGRGERKLFFTWDYLFEIGNLQQTAISNSRVAKAKIRRKMDKFKKGHIIETCEEDLIGMKVHPKKQKKESI